MDQAGRARGFQAMHQSESAFVIPNPWDVGSARLLAGLGFKALATTSAGFAYSIGRADGAVGRAAMIAHVRDIAAATALPVSADLENCYAHAPEEAARTLVLAAEAGAVGGSIEDYSGTAGQGIYAFDHAVERVAAAVEAVRGLSFPFMLTARAENLIRGRPDLDDTVARLQAFEKAGADVLYAPGLKTVEEVRTVCAAVTKPVNVLAVSGLTLAELSAAGAKRVSVGSALQRATMSALFAAVRETTEEGGFAWVADATPMADMTAFMAGESE